MLTTQARLAMSKHQPVKYIGDLYLVRNITYDGMKAIATIKKVSIASSNYKPIRVDVQDLEVVHEI
ncbi:MAG: hypothetical protein ACI31O_06560 [Limosilactobacillus vaginalis]|uniref:hypothetical protein n=1 Tax=Limosilactobacillus vaginalis TaxID=1633 RepID=UPI003F00088C